MKKTFPLSMPGKDDQRVIESIKNVLRKYVRRERRKSLPKGFDCWDFNCRVGQGKQAPESTPLAGVASAVDAAAKSSSAEVFVEILAVPGHRPYPQPAPPAHAS